MYSKISAIPVAPPLNNWAWLKNKLIPKDAVKQPIKMIITSKIKLLLFFIFSIKKPLKLKKLIIWFILPVHYI